MCGIVGYAGSRAAPMEALLAVMRDSLSHRGPDAYGLWAAPDQSVIFGHRRLAILDLSQTGAQPMENSRGSTVVVFNGEIYNHRELRTVLASRGATFVGHSDTEVLLAAYDEWGEDCVEQLRGMFAFAIYDKHRRQLFLARDRAGEKPLFWTRHRNGFMFASEIKALLADPSLPRQLSPEGLGYYLSFGYVPGDSCILRGIHKLPPAHCLTWSLAGGEPKVRRYWQLPAPSDQEFSSAEDLTEELHQLLTAAVAEQLVADVPLAVLLSGGIDSSLITAIAAKAADRRIQTFTITLPAHPELDERKFADAVAAQFNTDHVELPLDQSSVDLIERLAAQYDEPLADSSMIPTYLLAQTVRQHCTVVLGGDGGDELFGGYRSYQGAIQRERIVGRIPAPLRTALASAVRALPSRMRGRNYLLALEGTQADGIAQSAIWIDHHDYSEVSPWLAERIPDFSAKPWRRKLVEPRRGLPGAAMAADFSSYLPEDILVKVDRASMLCSLETRAPFLDRRIIEFAFGRVPNCLRTTAQERKILLKRLARRLLPADFDVDRKQGFTIPISQWLSSELLHNWTQTCGEQIESVFSIGTVQGFIRTRETVASEHKLYAVLMLTSWMRHYGVTV